MHYNPQSPAQTYNQEQRYAEQQALRQILSRVFLYMGLGLLLTFATASLLAYTGVGLSLLVRFGTFPLLIVLFVQIGLVIAISAKLRSQQRTQAKGLFFAYSLVMGLTVSFFFLAFRLESIVMALLATAIVFGAMALWGSRTQRDLSALGTAGRMLLIGAIAVSLLNLLLHFLAPGFASALDMVLNYVVLAIFIGLTAYDMNRIKQSSVMALQMGASPELIDSLAVNGALALYLDFINMFLRILSIFGRSRD